MCHKYTDRFPKSEKMKWKDVERFRIVWICKLNIEIYLYIYILYIENTFAHNDSFFLVDIYREDLCCPKPIEKSF